ncbi:MAG: hypothetical protein RLZZ385_663 [Pseudomonadota bacterium]|jgi:hypothetical protein
MYKLLNILALTLVMGAANGAYASDGEQNWSSACATLEFMAKMVAVNLLLPADHDNLAQLSDMQNYLLELNRAACQSAILTRDTRFSPRYGNGMVISTDLYYAPWYFSNGVLFMAAPGADTVISYPNGKPMAQHWMHGDDALFWPNGRLATGHFRTFDVTWYYPGGQIVTYEAGFRGGRWFYPFARLDGRIGQEEISNRWGKEDEHFSFINFRADGSVYLTRERIYGKLVLDDIDLLDVPGVLLLITRLYQQSDAARLFVPADANITGAPF